MICECYQETMQDLGYQARDEVQHGKQWYLCRDCGQWISVNLCDPGPVPPPFRFKPGNAYL
ncbi:MAG: hypothetical protein MUO26_15485 [Methanotrichaceae archaeon]|nr:hypothetical protein [Methanotrichaceae archaeon]